MTDNITLIGLVATPPRHLTTSAGLAITSFRLASTQRRFDRTQNKWIDLDTNWYTITAFRQLALNTAASINKGDRIVVNGRLRIRDWQNGDKTGTSIDVDADALGHDLGWGTATWVRTTSTAITPVEHAEAEPASFPSGGGGGFGIESSGTGAGGQTSDVDEARTAPQDHRSTDDVREPVLHESVPTPF